MINYWISWYHDPKLRGGYELHSPWWVSGYAGSNNRETICAAVKADNEEDAKQIIQNCYDIPQIFDISNWRFIEEQPHDWNPFNNRFPKATWMIW